LENQRGDNMARLNKTRYALLGVLSMGNASGYDIKVLMEQSTDHFWKEGAASIYPILKQLMKEKLVSLQRDAVQHGRPKKIYAITRAGKEVLQEWLEKEPEPIPVRNELLLKVFFGWNTKPEVIIKHLENFRHNLEKLLQKYRSSRLFKMEQTTTLNNVELYRFLALKAGIMHAELRIKWCDESIQMIKKHGK
jgi:PadR family transcriptional regulator, regulatory protein AphA